MRSILSVLRRAAALGIAATLSAVPALATWSIVVVDHRTGEIALFSATCVTNVDLERVLGMMRVEDGAAAIQFTGDPSVAKRQFIWNALESGDSPAQILADMQTTFGDMAVIQLGIASFTGPPVTFTGGNVWDPNAGIAGTVGDLSYAIQGNVITGDPVVLEAERALLETEGDLFTRVLSAMEASRAMGGDGRCSCSDTAPGACGSPPDMFDKSAYVGFLIVSRVGDTQGSCIAGQGCTNGEYYFHRRVAIGGPNFRDPVIRLFERARQWQQSMIGVTDQLRTEVDVDRDLLVADGVSSARVMIRLVDRDGTPLTVGGQTVTVTPEHGGADPAIVQGLVDHGDGTHSFELVSTTNDGVGEWHVRVDDGTHDVLLWPPVVVETEPLVAFHSSANEVEAGTGADVVLTTNLSGNAGAPYRVLGSLSGTVPGTTLQGVHVPLNPDRLYGITLGATTPRVFEGFAGTLDASGRAEATLHLDPALATVFVGSRFDFVAFANGTVTDVDGFDVVP